MFIREIICEADQMATPPPGQPGKPSQPSQPTQQQPILRPESGEYTVSQSVKDLQTKLQSIGYDLGPPGIDGKFGPHTANAVEEFKADYKLGKGAAVSGDDMATLNKVVSGSIKRVAKPTRSSISTNNNPLNAVSGADSSGFKWAPGVDKRVSQEVLSKLMAVQNEFDKQFVITSGYRDPERNRKAGGAKNSAHVSGEAVDVKFSGTEQDTNRFVELASRAGFGGIGVYRPGLVHVDVREKRAWGPSYRFASVPSWAKETIQSHLA